MALYRRAAKRDDAEPAVVERLVQLGATVARISGRNLPDLAVGWRGVTHLAEVKTDKRDKKRDQHQRDWARDWRGSPVVTLRTPEEATAWLLSLKAPPVVSLVMDRTGLDRLWPRVDEMGEG